MPHVYYLNPPPNPFWDFVSGLEDHPFFRGPLGRPQGRFSQTTPSAPPTTDQPAQPVMSEKAKGKQATVENEDPPEVDPSTVNPKTRQEAREERRAARHEDRDQDRDRNRFRGRGRFANAFDGDEKDVGADVATDKHEEQNKQAEEDGRACRRRDGRPCRMGRRDGPEPGPERAWRGPPPFMHPFFTRGAFGPQDSHHPGPHHPGPHQPGPRGPPLMRGRGGHHGRHNPPSPPQPPQQLRDPFDLNTFLNSLGERIGIDLTGAAASLGLDTPLHRA